MRYLDPLKKIFVLTIAAISISIVSFTPVRAASSTDYYLWRITTYTYSILQFLQNPANFAGLGVSLMQQDTGKNSITTQAQQNLAISGVTNAISLQITKSLQRNIIADIVGRPLSTFSGKNPDILIDLPQINNLSFGTLIGAVPVEKAPTDMYEFIKNTASFNDVRPIPDSAWDGNDDAKKKYKDYYDTVTSIQSFDAYLLTRITLDNAMGGSETREKLIDMASNSSWIAQIATEELGRVLRQILLFESQNFVLNMKMQESMQLMASAQAMTNTLLIRINEVNEYNLLRAARGKTNY